MKVLYANPVFLDYRLPFYKKLNELFEGNFHVMFSKERYRILGREDLYKQIIDELGENAHPLLTDFLFDTHSMSFHMKDINKGKHIPLTFGLMRAIRKIKPDILITEGFFQWTPLVILYGKIFGIPVYIGYERTPHTERNSGKIKKYHRKLTDKFVKGYLVNGSQTKEYLESLNISPDKIHIGGMSADGSGLIKHIQRMKPKDKDELKNNLRINDKGVTFLFVGRLCEEKGIGHLLKIWMDHIDNFKNDKLIVVGGGIIQNKLEKKFIHSSVYFAGSVPYNEVYKYYSIAQVFILPTLQDNWSLVIPEAMSCGLPVATTIYNGCYPELVKKDINGYVFDILDKESVMQTLAYFHKVDLKAFGSNSKIIEKDFDTEHCALRVYNALTQYK